MKEQYETGFIEPTGEPGNVYLHLEAKDKRACKIKINMIEDCWAQCKETNLYQTYCDVSSSKWEAYNGYDLKKCQSNQKFIKF